MAKNVSEAEYRMHSAVWWRKKNQGRRALCRVAITPLTALTQVHRETAESGARTSWKIRRLTWGRTQMSLKLTDKANVIVMKTWHSALRHQGWGPEGNTPLGRRELLRTQSHLTGETARRTLKNGFPAQTQAPWKVLLRTPNSQGTDASRAVVLNWWLVAPFWQTCPQKIFKLHSYH